MMAAEQKKRDADRRERVVKLKRIIIAALIIMVLLPTIICIILGMSLYRQSIEIKELKKQLLEIEIETEEIVQASVFVTGDVEESSRERQPASFIKEEDDNITLVREVYLTFDDGPSSKTNKILDILKEYEVKATFFVVGKEDELSVAAYRRIVEEGHTLAMHSYSHKYNEIYKSVESYAEDLTKLQEYLYEVTGIWPRYVRFPGGSSNSVSRVNMQELIAYLNDMGIIYYDWNIASGDATQEYISAEQIVRNCLNQLNHSGSNIILMHDAVEKTTTVDALPALLEAILEMEDTVILPITDDTVPVQHIAGG